MAGLAPEHRIRVPVLAMEWRNIAFVHWRFPWQSVQALLPGGVSVETYDGSAWVSLAPFLMDSVGPPGPPVLRRMTFAETNLRTYVRGPDGRDGIWFLRIYATRNSAVAAARLAVGAPYSAGRLSVQVAPQRVAYAGTDPSGKASYQVAVSTGRVLEQSEHDSWLTGRWRAYTRHAGILLQTPIFHRPWPLLSATLDGLHQTVTTAAGLPPCDDPPLVHYSPGVEVRFGLSRPAGRALSGR